VLITARRRRSCCRPGSRFVGLSQRAWQATERAKLPRFYFDFRRERKGVAEKSTAWTPAISLIQGCASRSRMMRTRAGRTSIARHERSRARRAPARRRSGLELLARSRRARRPPPSSAANVDGAGIVRYLRDKMHVTFAGGQDQLKGKIVRVAHLGYVGTFDVVTGLAALELALQHFGAPVELGRGVGAAEAILREGCRRVSGGSACAIACCSAIRSDRRARRLREQPTRGRRAPGSRSAELRDVIGTTTRSSSAAAQGDRGRDRHADRLRVIGRAGIGVDNVDVDAATKRASS
jgi:hypothetical protein